MTLPRILPRQTKHKGGPIINLSIVLDLVAVVILVVCAAVYAHKGFISGLVVLVGTALAMVLAVMLADLISPAVFENFFREGIEQRTVEAISQQSVENIGELLRGVLTFLPGDTVDMIVDSIGINLDFTATNLAQQVVEQIIAPLVIPIISIVVFFVVFGVVKLVVRLIAAALTSMNRMPVLGNMNQALGAGIGIFIGALYIFLLLCIIWAMDAAYGGALGSELFGNSILYRLLQNVNIFA